VIAERGERRQKHYWQKNGVGAHARGGRERCCVSCTTFLDRAWLDQPRNTLNTRKTKRFLVPFLKPSTASGARPFPVIWGQTHCWRMETKRQQAAALQALRSWQCPLHLRQRVRNHYDQRALPCDGVVGHIPQPGVAEGLGGARAGGVARQATLVPGRRAAKHWG